MIYLYGTLSICKRKFEYYFSSLVRSVFEDMKLKVNMPFLFQFTLNFPRPVNWSSVQVEDYISGIFTSVTGSQNARMNPMKKDAKMVYSSPVLAPSLFFTIDI